MGRSGQLILTLFLVLAFIGVTLAGDSDAIDDPGAELMRRAAELQRQGDWPAAEAAYLEALELREQSLGPDHPRVAETLVALSKLVNKAGDLYFYRTADWLERARRIDPSALDPAAEGLRLFVNFEIAKAVELLSHAVEEAEADHGPESLEVAELIDLAVEAAVLPQDNGWPGRGAVPDLERPIERSIAIKRAILGQDHPDTMWSRQLQGTLVASAGRLEEASDIFEEAKEYWEERFGPQSPAVGVALTWRGIVDWKGNQDRAEAARFFEPAYRVFRSSLGVADANTTGLLFFLGCVAPEKAADAVGIFDRIVASGKLDSGDARLGDAISMRFLSDALHMFGDFARSEIAGEKAIQDAEAVQGLNGAWLWYSLYQECVHLAESGDSRKAVRFARKMVSIQEGKSAEPDLLLAASLARLAFSLSGSSETWREAEELYHRSLEIGGDILGSDNPGLGSWYSWLGYLLERQGRYAEALPLQERSAPARVTTVDPADGDIGRVLDRLGRYRDALPYLEKAAGVAAGGYNRLNRAYYLSELARALAATGEARRASEAALESEELGREMVRLNARRMTEERALRFAAEGLSYGDLFRDPLDLAMSLAMRGDGAAAPAGAWNAAVRSRALILDEMSLRRRVLAGAADPEVRRLWNALLEASTRLANLTVRGGSAEDEAFIELLEATSKERERAELELAGKSAVFAREKKAASVGLEGVGSKLPEDAALLAFVAYEHSTEADVGFDTNRNNAGGEAIPAYAAFVLRAGSEDVAALRLGDVSEIDALVDRWRAEAARGVFTAGRSEKEIERAYRVAGNKLRGAVWDPVQPLLGDSSRVFVVPDGALNLVNFPALPVSDAGYLIEDGPTIHLVSAERDIALPPLERPAGSGLLALGGPGFDETGLFAALRDEDAESVLVATTDLGDGTGAVFRGQRSACGAFSAMRFEPLPGARREVEEIASLWQEHGASARLAGAAATETAFKLQAPGKRVLHLATHGFFLGDHCPSALDETRGIGGLASTSPVTPAPATDQAVENPLHLSGLVFAGANHREHAGPNEDDGILTAEEIAALDLSSVEWAVLSACDTGVGDIKAGEGVFGLRRAFQIAGVGTLIMSLWSVDDESTREWMTALYEGRLEQKMDTAEAVRQASLKVLERRRKAGESTHPFYWAGFVAAGDWR